MDVKLIKQAVSKVKSSLFKNSNSFSIGMLRSHFRGSGMQFKEHQQYNYGDDVRFIDWKIYAKSREIYIKTFEEERNVEIDVILDGSASMLYGHDGVSKLQASVEIAALLYLLAKETKDYVSLTLLTDKVISLPRASGEMGIVAMMNLLEKENLLADGGRINIEKSYCQDIEFQEYVKVVQKSYSKRREVVFLSDFYQMEDYNNYKKIFQQKSMHSFRMVSPLDRSSDVPFLLKFKTNSNNMTAQVKMQERSKKFENKKIKILNIDGRYLENFVKEML